MDKPVAKIYDPLSFHKLNLGQTASGYGQKLTTPYKVVYSNGATRRVYCTTFSNVGTRWVYLDGFKVTVSEGLFADLETIIA